MEKARRWSVTYTKHVKQKRKVYQDGFLELQSSRQKVSLYDEYDKLLDSRFVKKDDKIKSGETLAFDSYLVDIADQCADHNPVSSLNLQIKVEKDAERSRPFNPHCSSFSLDRKRTFVKKGARVTNLSPSQKIVRDFKKSEMNKFDSSPSCLDMTKCITTEWQVLYTTQITQKAKKFHDGVLELVLRGTHGRQVMLYDANRRFLDSRFLKKDEIVRSDESLAFEGHLVEIGEQKGHVNPAMDLTLEGKDCNMVGKTEIANYKDKLSTEKKLPAGEFRGSASREEFDSKVETSTIDDILLSRRVPTTSALCDGKTQGKASVDKLTILNGSGFNSKEASFSWRTPAIEPRRATHDILSILRKPITQGQFDTTKKPLVKDRFVSRSSDVQSYTKHHVNVDEANSKGSVQEDIHENSVLDSSLKILKSQAVDHTVSGNGTESEDTSPGFCVRTGATNFVTPTLNNECKDQIIFLPSSLSVEAQSMVPPVSVSEVQLPIQLAFCRRSNNNEELDDTTIINSSPASAATNGLKFADLTELIEDNKESNSGYRERASSGGTQAVDDWTSHIELETRNQNSQSKEAAEFPSFDLGF